MTRSTAIPEIVTGTLVQRICPRVGIPLYYNLTRVSSIERCSWEGSTSCETYPKEGCSRPQRPIWRPAQVSQYTFSIYRFITCTVADESSNTHWQWSGPIDVSYYHKLLTLIKLLKPSNFSRTFPRGIMTNQGKDLPPVGANSSKQRARMTQSRSVAKVIPLGRWPRTYLQKK